MAPQLLAWFRPRRRPQRTSQVRKKGCLEIPDCSVYLLGMRKGDHSTQTATEEMYCGHEGEGEGEEEAEVRSLVRKSRWLRSWT